MKLQSEGRQVALGFRKVTMHTTMSTMNEARSCLSDSSVAKCERVSASEIIKHGSIIELIFITFAFVC